MHSFRIRLTTYVVTIPLMLGFALVMMACVGRGVERQGEKDVTASLGGATVATIHLPVSPEISLQCVQGPNGPYSHQSKSTRYDIDLDTSNVLDESVFAPSSGLAYVHRADAHKNFGEHVNIDQGDGTYVVIAHLSTIVVRHRSEVATGQLLGYEGCSGNCSGDHIHVGLHRGDASIPAQFGESVPVSYLIADAGSPRGFKAMHVDFFRCGIKAAGDDLDGLFYTSVLDPTLFHPTGSLVKTPTDPRVYRVEGEYTRWIVSEEIFKSYAYSFSDIAVISDEELSCYGEGSPIDQLGMVDAISDSDGQIWLIVGPRHRPDRYRLQVRERAWEGVLSSWGLSMGLEFPRRVDHDHDYLTQWPHHEGNARFREGSIVREWDRPDLYIISNKMPLPIADWKTYLLLGFHDHFVLTIDPGDLGALYSQTGSCRTGFMCLGSDDVQVCGGGLEIDLNLEPEPVIVEEEHDQENDDAVDEPEVIEVQDEVSATEDDEPTDETGAAMDVGTPEDSQEEEPSADEHQEHHQEEELAVELVVSIDACEAFICVADLDQDGQGESLLMADHLWINNDLAGEDAFVYAYGACYNGTLTQENRVVSHEGFYLLDFRSFPRPCDIQLTLISSVGTDAQLPDEFMGNWNWWQAGDFCWQSTPLCHLMNNGQPWEEWLISLKWHPHTGLVPNGNGFVSNQQF